MRLVEEHIDDILAINGKATARARMGALGEYFAMGGYAAYVWAAFALTFLVMAALFWQSWHAARKRGAEVVAWREQRGAAFARPARRLVAEPPPRSGETRASEAS